MSTSVYGINDEGDVSGTYYDGSLHGFIRTSNGVYTSINLGPHTVVSGINNNGQVFGSTDEIGMRAQDHPVHVHDVHASILWQLGLDHMQLTYLHNGRAERPTVFAGEVVKGLFA